MKKKIIGLCAIMLLASGCGKVPKLENGQDAIVQFKDGGKISVDDFYQKIKDDFGLDTLISMVDTYILENEFSDYKETAKQSAEAYIKGYIEQFGSKEKLLEQIQSSQLGFQTVEAYQNYIYVSFLQNHAFEEYAKAQISDKDVEKYYKNKAIGDMDISHILITSDASSSASKEDKTKAEEEAKKKVEEIIAKLNEAKKENKNIEEEFSKLASEYSKDDSTKNNGGKLGKISYGDLNSNYDELIDAAAKLKDGEYSTKVITTANGFHVILKTKSYEKESLENLKDKIIDILAQEYISKNSSSLALSALQHYRKQYNMEIQDDEVKKQYSDYISRALAAIQNANSSQQN